MSTGKKERKNFSQTFFFWSAQVIPGRAPSSSNTNLGQQPLSDLPSDSLDIQDETATVIIMDLPEETVFAYDYASKLKHYCSIII